MSHLHRAAAIRVEKDFLCSLSRRALLPLLGAAILAPHASAQNRTTQRRGSVVDFGADPTGARDSSPAFTEAIKQLDIVEVPVGRFMVGNIRLRAGITITGAGEDSLIIQKSDANYALFCDSDSADPAENLRAITLTNFQLRGSCDTDGFSEFIHLLSLNGVSDATIERVIFRGFRGDGLYLGSSNKAKTERHNFRVVVRNCLFDGINRENRNAVSVIDCDDLLVTKCRFMRTTRPNMPGAIDVEPNASPFHVVQNIRIADNSFSDIGGNVGVISMYIPAALTVMPSNIVVEGNKIDGATSSAFSFIQRFPPAPDASKQSIVIRRNQVVGKHTRPFDIRGVLGIELSDNQFDNSTQAGLIGYRDGNTIVREVTLRGNLFQRCGSEGGVGISVFTVSGMQFVRNEWRDCGNGKPASYGVDFNAGKSERVNFVGNKFTSTAGKPLIAIQKEASHTFSADSNVFTPDNVLGSGMRSVFEAKGTQPR